MSLLLSRAVVFSRHFVLYTSLLLYMRSDDSLIKEKRHVYTHYNRFEMKEKLLEINELQDKLVCAMTGKELLALLSTSHKDTDVKNEKKYVHGIPGIASLFGCSIPTASRIKQSGIIDDAITQIGRKIVVDAEKALSLVAESKKQMDN